MALDVIEIQGILACNDDRGALRHDLQIRQRLGILARLSVRGVQQLGEEAVRCRDGSLEFLGTSGLCLLLSPQPWWQILRHEGTNGSLSFLSPHCLTVPLPPSFSFLPISLISLFFPPPFQYPHNAI